MSSTCWPHLLHKIVHGITTHLHLPHFHRRPDAPCPSLPETDTDPIKIVKKDHGTTTIYNIQSIHITINADTVSQLNVNPKEVVNLLQSQLETELNNIQPPPIPPHEESKPNTPGTPSKKCS